MEQILLPYSLPKEAVAAIMMLYRTQKLKSGHRTDGHTDYLDIVADVLQGNALAPYLFIISLDYVIRTSIDLMKEEGFKPAKERSRRYSVQTITDSDNADDIVLQANTPAQAEYQVHNLQRAAGGRGLHVNADKTEYICFNQRSDIYTLKSGRLKQVDRFTYIGSSVSSIEKDINMQLAKAWTAIDRLSVMWKSYLTDKIKQFFLSSNHVDTAIWMHYMDAH